MDFKNKTWAEQIKTTTGTTWAPFTHAQILIRSQSGAGLCVNINVCILGALFNWKSLMCKYRRWAVCRAAYGCIDESCPTQPEYSTYAPPLSQTIRSIFHMCEHVCYGYPAALRSMCEQTKCWADSLRSTGIHMCKGPYSHKAAVRTCLAQQ